MNERLSKLMESLGFPTNGIDEEMIADALESLIYSIDHLADAHDHYAEQINAYCVELENDIQYLATEVEKLEKITKVVCTCSITSKTMRELM